MSVSGGDLPGPLKARRMRSITSSASSCSQAPAAAGRERPLPGHLPAYSSILARVSMACGSPTTIPISLASLLSTPLPRCQGPLNAFAIKVCFYFVDQVLWLTSQKKIALEDQLADTVLFDLFDAL